METTVWGLGSRLQRGKDCRPKARILAKSVSLVVLIFFPAGGQWYIYIYREHDSSVASRVLEYGSFPK